MLEFLRLHKITEYDNISRNIMARYPEWRSSNRQDGRDGVASADVINKELYRMAFCRMLGHSNINTTASHYAEYDLSASPQGFEGMVAVYADFRAGWTRGILDSLENTLTRMHVEKPVVALRFVFPLQRSVLT